MKIMGKRGSHVGVVLSILIFIVFAVFLYTVLEPSFRSPGGKELIIDSLKSDIIKNISANMTTLSVTNDDSAFFDCLVVMNGQVGITTTKLNTIVKDKDDNIVPNLDMGIAVLIETGSLEFFKVYYSLEFEPSEVLESANCVTTDPYPYYTSLGLIRTKEYVFENKIRTFINTTYEDEYSNLKENFNLPEGTEFGVGFKYNNGTIITTPKQNVSTSIYVKEFPTLYVDKEANINSGSILIRVW